MQLPCLPGAGRCWRALGGLGWVLGLWLGLSGGLAAQAVPQSAPQNLPQNAHAALFESARQWLVQTQGEGLQAIEFMPLDPRLQVQACGRPVSMDMPFGLARAGQPGTVRVRCAQPQWQLYVQYQFPAAAPARAASASSASPPGSEVRAMVAAMALARGSSLGESQIDWATVDGGPAGGMVLTDLAQLRHMELARDVKAGTVLRLSDLRPALMVRKGQQVLLQIGTSPGFQISARVEALQDGRHGEVIRLKNPESGKQIKGRVVGPNQAVGL